MYVYVYVCVFVFVSVLMSVYTLDTPEQPQSVLGLTLNSTAILLMWTEPHDNNAPITGYVIRYQQPQFLGGGEVSRTSPDSDMAVIADLHPGVTYTFTVEAFNGIGTGRQSSEIQVNTSDERKMFAMYLLLTILH